MRFKGYCELGFAKLDTDRVKRRGFPEVIYAPGKSDSQIRDIAAKIIACRHALLVTKVKKETYGYLKESFAGLQYNPSARAAYIKIGRTSRPRGFVLIVSAGTADIPVAEEAAVALEVMGVRIERMYDVGVAGVHRLLDKQRLLRRAKVIVVAAGMEGALASVVSGLVSSPVIALPTSVGYGANFKGLSALLTMLNSCSPGVAVVNIDNGFGAGYFAGLINRNSRKR